MRQTLQKINPNGDRPIHVSFDIDALDPLEAPATGTKGTPLCFKKWANPGLFLFIFVLFLVTISIQIEKSVDGVLGIRTRGRRMVGADESTELTYVMLTRISNCFTMDLML